MPHLLHPWLTRVLHDLDPMGCTRSAPLDEYSREAALILEQAQVCGDVEALHRAIHGVFVRQFSAAMAGEPARFDRLAAIVWGRLHPGARVEPEG